MTEAPQWWQNPVIYSPTTQDEVVEISSFPEWLMEEVERHQRERARFLREHVVVFVNMETPMAVQLRMFEDFFGDGDLDEDPEATSVDSQTVRWAEVAADGEREIEEWDRILSPLREEQ